MYNPSFARFFSVDPLYRYYPWYSPYQFAGNHPIYSGDLDGLEPDKTPVLLNDIDLITEHEISLDEELLYYEEKILEAEEKQINAHLGAIDKIDKSITNTNYSILAASRFLGKGIQSDFVIALLTCRQLMNYQNLYEEQEELEELLLGHQKALEDYTARVEELTVKLDKTTSILVYDQASNTYSLHHKNNNNYTGKQGVYEIKINGKTWKFGKADMTKISSSGLPTRLQTQIPRTRSDQ